MRLLSVIKNTVFLLWLVGALVSLSIGASIWAVQATATAARLGVEMTNSALRHRKELASIVMKVKAEARLKRIVVMFPFAGIAAGAYFEEQDYNEWLESNPEGSRAEYLCELADATAEVLDEFLTNLPVSMRPSNNVVNDMLPKCSNESG